MNSKKIIMPIFYSICAMFIIIGVSFAYWIAHQTQSSVNRIETNCLQLEFTETSSAIELLSAEPISDDDGSKLIPYTFTLENKCNSSEFFSINLEELNTTTLNDKYVKVKINSADATNLADHVLVDTTLDNAQKSKNLVTGSLSANEVKEYSLRIYLDGETAVDADSMNKVFESQITITGSLTKIELPKVYKMINDINNNGIADLGDEIALGSEHFFVFENNDGTISALAKYNLNVGNNTNPNVEIGLQDESIKGYLYSGTIYGNVAYSNSSANYSGSIVEGYVNEYVERLNSEYSRLHATGRLLTKTEVDNFINDGEALGYVYISSLANTKGYPFLYGVSYWLGSEHYPYSVWTIYADSSLYDDNYDRGSKFGVRPVIVFTE